VAEADTDGFMAAAAAAADSNGFTPAEMAEMDLGGFTPTGLGTVDHLDAAHLLNNDYEKSVATGGRAFLILLRFSTQLIYALSDIVLNEVKCPYTRG